MAFSNQPESLGSVLQKLIDRMGLRDKIDGARIVEAWATVAGPQINGVTDAAWVKHGVLYVKVTSAAWRHELHLRREAWRQRVNDHLGSDLVDEIVFR